MNKISLCITNYNRSSYLFKSFEQVIEDERIHEVVVVDDCSEIGIYKTVEEMCKYHPKIKLFRNQSNAGVYKNKKIAVSLAESEYCIVFDSDNIISSDYLDKVYSVAWEPKTIFAPDFAEPVFDYRKYSSLTLNRTNAGRYAFQPQFDCLLNTMNYFVHRDTYLQVWKPKRDIKGADSIWFNYLWLSAGNEIHVLQGLRYYHRTDHNGQEHGSNFLNHARESTPVCKEIERMIQSMR